MKPVEVGKLLKKNYTQRDAIHIAVLPVTAGEHLKPGQRVALIGDSGLVGARTGDNIHGVVDPFLQNGVKPGDRFFMFLLPNTITSLYHHWAHPVIDKRLEEAHVKKTADILMGVTDSHKWMMDFAARNLLSMEEVVDAASEYIRDGEYFIHPRDGGLLDGVTIPDEFWDHYDVINGTKTPEESRGHFFSCSC